MSMDPTLKLFIVGFFVGLLIALVPLPGEINMDEPNFVPKQIFAGGVTIWKTVYFSILIIILPFGAIEPLKKRLHLKFFPFSFIIGNSTSMLMVSLIITISTLF